jgi:hypothetical protein
MTKFRPETDSLGVVEVLAQYGEIHSSARVQTRYRKLV